MTDVTVLILHPEPAPRAGELERWVAAARAELAERHRVGFLAAGATDVTPAQEWWDIARLGPAERARLATLAFGEDRLLMTASARRVAARVTGEPVDRLNHLTCGRLAAAQLVGSGPEAPLRMAALEVIGSTICMEEAAACSACPLLQFCPGPALAA